MNDALPVLALGFFLGMRHATDADHVVAVTTIVARQRELRSAAVMGVLWGVGHTLTLVAVGAAIILLNLTIPYRLGIGMEISVGVMLVVLGGFNVAAFLKHRPPRWLRAGARAPRPHVHSHGDYVHSHSHGADPETHPHPPDLTPLAAIDRWFEGARMYRLARPIVVGIVHGLAGSAAVTLLVVAAVREPRWAVGYLLVFGLGTMAGMMLITMSLASAFRVVGGRSPTPGGRLVLACGVVSIVFGLSFAYQTWAAAGVTP